MSQVVAFRPPKIARFKPGDVVRTSAIDDNFLVAADDGTTVTVIFVGFHGAAKTIAVPRSELWLAYGVASAS